MRKLFLLIGFLTISALTVNAQDIAENAIGIRFGDNNGAGAELSYQHRLSNVNRLEVDLGIRGNKNYSAFRATGLYEWVWQLENRFNWYAGVGGGFGSWKNKISDDTATALFGAGVIGVEYSFDIPLMVSLDYRPEFGFSDVYDGFNSDFGLSVRYQF